MKTRLPLHGIRRRPQGFSLIELMVTIVIGLVVVLAVTSVMTTNENYKRTTTSTNDINLGGAYTLSILDKAVRSAGTGFMQSYAASFGCPLNASRGGAQILPSPAALPAPFANMVSALGAFRVAPVIIAKGRSSFVPGGTNTPSDVLITMSGSSGYGEVPVQSLGAPQLATLTLFNTISFVRNDLMLVTDQPGATMTPCMIEQVAAGFPGGGVATALPLGGAFYTPTGANQQLVGYSVNSTVSNLGQTPSLMLYGVGTNTALYSFDLLNSSTANPANLVSDGVIDLRALYYVDTNGDKLPDTWINPVAGTGYADTELLSGSPAASINIQNIKAVRIGLILRSALQDTNAIKGGPPPTPNTLSMFTDLGPGFTYTRSLSADDQKYRYRVVETTIPLRNPLN